MFICCLIPVRDFFNSLKDRFFYRLILSKECFNFLNRYFYSFMVDFLDEFKLTIFLFFCFFNYIPSQYPLNIEKRKILIKPRLKYLFLHFWPNKLILCKDVFIKHEKLQQICNFAKNVLLNSFNTKFLMHKSNFSTRLTYFLFLKSFCLIF